MREASLEQKIVGSVKSRGGKCLKWVSPGYTGVPDRIVFLPGGKIVFAEIKKPGTADGRSPRQKRVAQILTRLGQKVIRVDSLEEFEEYIDGM